MPTLKEAILFHDPTSYQMWLCGNKLTGEIPSELAQLCKLTLLHLAGNQLTGSIPPNLCQLSNLRDLDLSNNQLTGAIPPELGQLSNLEHLYLQNNQLTGGIPPELAQLTKLKHLLLFNNQLTGNIPTDILAIKFDAVNIGNNMFILPNPIPNKWRCGEQRTEKLSSEDCESGRVKRFQSWIERNVNDEKITSCLWNGIQAAECGMEAKEAIIAGEVPIGFPDSLKWPTITNAVQLVKEKMIYSQQREQELINHIQDLRAELVKCKEEYSLIHESSIAWEEMNESFEKSIIWAQNYQKTEETLSRQLVQALLAPDELSDENLALVFNAVGLSSKFIQKSAGTTGEEFLDYDFIASLDGITASERLEAQYCKHMMEIHKIPYEKHKDDDCAICFCSTAEELIEFIVEHKWNLDADVVKNKKLTGPKFLMMTAKDLGKVFSLQRDKAKQIWKEKKRIHYDTLSIVTPTC